MSVTVCICACAYMCAFTHGYVLTPETAHKFPCVCEEGQARIDGMGGQRVAVEKGKPYECVCVCVNERACLSGGNVLHSCPPPKH